jgi:glycosyltransferase involved in cell wall biosynthesis
MINFPKITIITPSFNQGKFIDQTIRSILLQDYPNIEYIVMDGGSTDQTIDILKRYGERLTWKSEKDRGQSHAINKGMALATGEIVGFINSDDFLEPGALEKVGFFFATHPEADWLTGKCRTVNEQGSEIRKVVTGYKNILLMIKAIKILLVVNFISQPATFWRKKITDDIGGFDESLQYSMDYDYWLRISRRYRLYSHNDYLACFRVHSGSKAGSSASQPFDSQLSIASRYTTSKVLLGLQTIHNRMIIYLYKHLLSRGGNLYSDKSSKGSY